VRSSFGVTIYELIARNNLTQQSSNISLQGDASGFVAMTETSTK